MRALFASVLAIAPACTLDGSGGGDVEIRMCNLTGHDISDVTYHELAAPAVADGACTGYEPVDVAFRYTNVRLSIGADEFLLQPIDYVGEEPLESGRWSYNVGIRSYETRDLYITAVED